MQNNLENIFVTQRPVLVASLMRIVGSRQIAEELVQESYLRVARAMAERKVEHVQAFLYQTARNLALDHRRSQAVRGRFEVAGGEDEIGQFATEDDSPEAALLARERRRMLEKALAELPERVQQVMILGKLHGWSYPRIAAHLGVSANTVYGDMKLALAHCRAADARWDKS